MQPKAEFAKRLIMTNKKEIIIGAAHFISKRTLFFKTVKET